MTAVLHRSALWIGALAVALFATVGARADLAPMEIDGATTVDAEAIIDLITNQADLVILDNRREGDFNAGHIEGAVRLIDTDVTGPDVLEMYIPSPDTPVLMYCNGLACGRAANVVQMAVDWGYSNVYYYALGMEEWNELGLPLVSN